MTAGIIRKTVQETVTKRGVRIKAMIGKFFSKAENWLTAKRAEAILLVVFGFGLLFSSGNVAYIAIEIYGFTWLSGYVEHVDRHEVHVPILLGLSAASLGLILSGLAKLIASCRR